MKYRGELFGTPPTTSRTNLIQEAPKALASRSFGALFTAHVQSS